MLIKYKNMGDNIVQVKCEYCEESFDKKGKYMRRSKHHFCCKICYGLWMKKNGHSNRSDINLMAQRKIKHLAELRRKRFEGNLHKPISDGDIS